MDSLGVLLLAVWCVALVKSDNDYEPVRMCNGDYETAGRCFVSVDQPMDWHSAEYYCVDSLPKPGHLAAIEDPTSQSLVAGEVASKGWSTVWINGCLKDRFWFWQRHWPPTLAYQGCWEDDESNPDLPITLPTTADTTPTDCRQMCAQQFQTDDEYHVTGIQQDPAGNIQCHCSSNWKKKYERSYDSACDNRCPGSDLLSDDQVIDKFCGGPGHQLIYYGTGSEFQAFAPSAARSYNHCVVMNPDHDYAWTEHDCHDVLPYICHYNWVSAEDDCNSHRSYMWADGACVSFEMQAKSFYEAQGDCEQYGGKLLKVENSAVHESLRNYLNNNGNGMMYFIGLTDEEWIFSYWELVYKYYNWGTNQPAQGPDQICFAMKASDNYRWYNIDCDIPAPFVCMVDIYEETPTTHYPDHSPEQTTIEPDPADSSTKKPIVSPEILIGAGAGAGGTIVIVIIVVIICCCCCKRNKRRDEEYPRSADNQRRNRNENKDRQLPRPPRGYEPRGQQHRGPPVDNPAYQSDQYGKGRRYEMSPIHRGSFNDPHYMKPDYEVGRDNHEYEDLDERRYGYLQPKAHGRGPKY